MFSKCPLITMQNKVLNLSFSKAAESLAPDRHTPSLEVGADKSVPLLHMAF